MTRRFTIIMNAASGNDAKERTRELLRDRLQSHGCAAHIVEIPPGGDVNAICEEAVVAARESGDIVVAAGGDGTLNTVAGFCHQHAVPMGIVPLGTFNYFARDLDISLDPAEAADTLVTGILRTVPAGMVGEKLFLVNASIGLYTDVIRNRESVKARLGRYRIVALGAAVASFFQRRRVFTVHLHKGAEDIMRRTMMVFVCKNRFQLENLGLAMADSIADDQLSISILKPARRLQIARILFRGMIGLMHGEKRVEELSATQFMLETDHRHARVVIDGEIAVMKTPLVFRAVPAALQVITPQPAVTP